VKPQGDDTTSNTSRPIKDITIPKTNNSNKKIMKKLIYLFLFISVTTASLSSCTEEEVKPQGDDTTSNTSRPIKE